MEAARNSKVGPLALIMMGQLAAACGLLAYLLYRAELNEQRSRLTGLAQSRASLLEAVGALDALHHRDEHTRGSVATTLSRLPGGRAAHDSFGETGEFILARRDGRWIEFLPGHRQGRLAKRRAVPFDSRQAEPMQRALRGEWGSMISLDHRGEAVLAAYAPVRGSPWGVVAKIDMAEIREPFLRTAALLALVGTALVAGGALLYSRLTAPQIRRIRQRAESLDLALQGAELGLWDWNVQTGTTTINERWAAMLGYTVDEIDTHYESWTRFLHPDDRPGVMKALADHHGGRTPGYEAEFRLRAKSGVWKWVLSRGKVFERDGRGRPVRMVGTHLDISSRKLAEQELRDTLRESKRRSTENQALLRAARAVLQHQTQEDSLREILACCRSLIKADAGCVTLVAEDETTSAIVARDGDGHACTTDAPRTMPVHGRRAEACRLRKPTYHNDIDTSERTELMPARRDSPENVLFAPLVIEERAVGLIELAQKRGGFTEQDAHLAKGFSELAAIALRNSRTSNELRASDRRHAGLIEESRDAILSLDMSGMLLSANTAAERVTGMSKETLIGRRFGALGLLRGESLTEALAEFALIGEGEERPAFELTLVRNDDTHVILEANANAIKWGGTIVGVQATLRDITERKRREDELRTAKEQAEKARAELEQMHAQLLQSDKMASIGQLAAGIAHEINNPIGFISSNLNSLGEYVEDLRRLLAAHDRLLGACLSGSGELPAQAEELARMRKEADIDFVMEDLDSLIKECADGTKRVRDIVADLRDFSHVDSPDVCDADINQLMDKTINVAWNELKYKAEVIREYGEIPTIPCYGGKLGQVFLNLLVNAAQAIEERGSITVRTGASGSFVWIEVADTGCGIPSENLNRIFEPFFTTKQAGQGVGMGLQLAYQIVEAHGGYIDAVSTVGEGTTFRVELPVAGPPETPASKTAEAV